MKRAVAGSLLILAAVALAQPQIDFSKIQKAQQTAVQPKADARVVAAETEYAIANYRHRADTFRWQLTSSKIIFWMVIGLVLAGVIFSAIQFGVVLRRKTDFSDAELALGVEGVKVKSQFLGVITLALSLAFFYLYLKTVYPITELQ